MRFTPLTVAAALMFLVGCANDSELPPLSTSSTTSTSTTVKPAPPTTKPPEMTTPDQRQEAAALVADVYPETTIDINEESPGFFIVRTQFTTADGLAPNGVCSVALGVLTGDFNMPDGPDRVIVTDTRGTVLARSTGDPLPVCRPAD
jgi:hypothetical protein